MCQDGLKEMLKYALSHDIEWLGSINHTTKGDFWEMQVWHGGECESYEAPTKEECIALAIMSDKIIAEGKE